MTTRRAISQRCSLLLAGAMVGLSTALVACGEEKQTTTAAESIDVHEYTVRGRIESLPDPARPMSQLQITHEPIPHFVGPGGELGMDAMTMPFPIASEVSLAGLAEGDVVEVVFTVDYDTRGEKPVAYRATSIEKLPPDTELVFE